jgi:hypothetical protein
MQPFKTYDILWMKIILHFFENVKKKYTTGNKIGFKCCENQFYYILAKKLYATTLKTMKTKEVHALDHSAIALGGTKFSIRLMYC